MIALMFFNLDKSVDCFLFTDWQQINQHFYQDNFFINRSILNSYEKSLSNLSALSSFIYEWVIVVEDKKSICVIQDCHDVFSWTSFDLLSMKENLDQLMTQVDKENILHMQAYETGQHISFDSEKTSFSPAPMKTSQDVIMWCRNHNCGKHNKIFLPPKYDYFILKSDEKDSYVELWCWLIEQGASLILDFQKLLLEKVDVLIEAECVWRNVSFKNAKSNFREKLAEKIKESEYKYLLVNEIANNNKTSKDNIL